MRGLGRRIRSSFGIGSARLAIRPQMAWYWRWLINVAMIVVVGGFVWWLAENSYRITGFNHEEARQQLEVLTEENRRIKEELQAVRGNLIERERLLQVDRAAQTELARTVAQLQEENALLKEDLGFLRRLMSSGTTPEGIAVSELKVEREGETNEYRYRLLLTQGGQRKHDFKGRVQILARVAQGSSLSTITYPDPDAAEASAFEFRFYHKVDGRFVIPEGAVLKSVEVRVLALPGGQVKLSRTINLA